MSIELHCANCDQRLDPTDKFCRECGLPTVRRAETQRRVAGAPPDVDELKRAMEAVPDPTPFVRASDMTAAAPPAPSELTTGSLLKVTNPTFAAHMAGSTLLMVGLIAVLALIGLVLIVLAIRL